MARQGPWPSEPKTRLFAAHIKGYSKSIPFSHFESRPDTIDSWIFASISGKMWGLEVGMERTFKFEKRHSLLKESKRSKSPLFIRTEVLRDENP